MVFNINYPSQYGPTAQMGNMSSARPSDRKFNVPDLNKPPKKPSAPNWAAISEAIKGVSNTADKNMLRQSAAPMVPRKSVVDRAVANTSNTADKNMLRQSQAPIGDSINSRLSRALAAISGPMATADKNMLRQSQRPVTTAPVSTAPVVDSADLKFMPQLPSSTGSTASSYDMGVPNNTNLFGYDPTPAAPYIDPADIKFFPGLDGAPSSFDLTAPNNEGLFGYQGPEETEDLSDEIISILDNDELTIDDPFAGSGFDFGDGFGGASGSGGAEFFGEGAFEGGYSDLARQYARIKYAADALARDKARGVTDIARAYDAALRALPGVYNSRGVLDSGLFDRGGTELYEQYYGDNYGMLPRFVADIDEQANLIDLSEWDAQSGYAMGGLDALANRARQLAEATTNTEGFI